MTKIIFFLLIPTAAFSQKKDSVKVDTAQMFFKEESQNILNALPNYLYERMTAKEYDDFIKNWNAFINEQYLAWRRKKGF